MSETEKQEVSRAIFHRAEFGLQPLNNNGELVFTRAMIASMYGVDSSTLSKQVKKAIHEGRIPVVAKMETTASDGKKYNIDVFSIDNVLELSFYLRTESSFSVRDWMKDLAKKELMRIKEENEALRISSNTAWRMLDKQDREDLYR